MLGVGGWGVSGEGRLELGVKTHSERRGWPRVLGEGQGLQEKPRWILWEGKRGYPKGSEGRTGG